MMRGKTVTPPVKIRRQNRHNLMIRATPDGYEVFIPHWMRPESREVQRFIKQALKQLDGRIPPPPPEQTSQEAIQAMVDEWAARIGVEPGRVQFRTMTRKWGSCSIRGNITLNTRLTWLPPHLAEYIVCHELVHMREFNHGQPFKAMMTAYMPDWKTREAELKILNFW